MSTVGGKTCLITGGAQGLGRAIADRFAASGARILVLDLPDALAKADLPKAWHPIPLDLTGPEAKAHLDEVLAAQDGLDTLVANAGVVPPWREVTDLDFTEWDRVFAINVRGMALSLGVAAPHLAKTQGAAVLMASINAYRAVAGQALYSASKHAVLGLMRAAAQDLGPLGVRVNALAPGPIMTEALQARIAARAADGGPDPDVAAADLAGETALGRLARPQDVAEAALYLASDQAAGITGICLPVEAGLA